MKINTQDDVHSIKHNLGKMLLDQLLDLKSYSPIIDDWSEVQFKDNPPRLIRFKRLNSFIKALNIKSGYTELFNGEFIQWSHQYSINKLIELDPETKRIDSFFEPKEQDWQSFYDQLMKHILLVDEVLNVNSGLLAASGLYAGFYLISSKTNKQIGKAINHEKTILIWLLNPENLEMSIEELVKSYDYPDDDLAEIDLEWV